MPFTLGDILCGGVAPAVVAGVALVLLRLLLSEDLGRRYSSSIAVLAGELTGIALLALLPWEPTTHWHWLQYTLIGAGIVGPVACAAGVHGVERVLLYGLFASVAGWLLVPMWEDLSPSRWAYLAVFVAYVTVLASLLEPLAVRLPGPLLPMILWATLTTAAVVLALSGSLRFAQLALAGAGALFGVTLAACFSRQVNCITGTAPLFSVLAVGLMLVGQVNSFSDIPLPAYLMLPAAPLLLWTTAAAPISRFSGIKQTSACASLPLVLLAITVLLAVWAENN